MNDKVVEPRIVDHLSRAVEKFFTPRPSPLTTRDTELLREGTPLDLASGLAATSWGEGPTVLLAHGWNSRRTHWGAFITPLIEAGFRAVAVDAPAHGDSPGTKANVLQYGMALVGVGQAIGPLVGVVGHSFGAGAIVVALQRGLSSDRAVLISGPASLTALMRRWGRYHELPESEIPLFVELSTREVGVPIEDFELDRIVPGLSQPALVVHDRSDKEIPLEDAMALASAWPGARLLITERYGHRRIMIAKPVVTEVVAFLKERSA